jgi:glycosyltransferase involved in cell wall biosynthesis
MAMLEAHRHGLPVVAGYTDGTATIVKDQVTGFLTEPENIKTFAQAVRHLLENHNLRETMERAAREKFLSDHTLEDAARALDSFLRSLTLS